MRTFSRGSLIESVFVDNDNVIWVRTNKSLSRFDGSSWVSFTAADGLLGNEFYSIVADHDNTIWVTTDGGISSYDGEEWTSHVIDGIRNDLIFTITVDMENAKWFNAFSDGILRYRKGEWTIFRNGPLQCSTIVVDNNNVKWFGGEVWSFDNEIWTRYLVDGQRIIVDKNNVKWFANYDRVVSYNGADWVTHTNNGEFINQAFTCAAVDSNNVKWFGTLHGLYSFNGAYWSKFTIQDGLGDNSIRSIKVDENNLKWIMTENSISIYDDSMIPVHVEETRPSLILFGIQGNHPNPFNPATIIDFHLDSDTYVTLDIYSMSGQLVKTLTAKQFTAGTHSVVWDGIDNSNAPAASGIYFVRLTAGGRSAVRRITLVR